MPRLKDRRVVLLSPYKNLSRVDLPHIKDGMNCNLDFGDVLA